MNNFLSYGRQNIDNDDIEAVVSVLKSDFLTQGPAVRAFEEALCLYTGARYAVTVANGTAALHIAVAALKLSGGSEGITTPITFAASANCLVYNDIKPLFCDICTDTYCIDPQHLEKTMGKKTKVIIPVHFAGQPAAMKDIFRLAKKHSCYVIEDAAHAIGSCYEDGSRVGNCRYSDMTIFSFHPVKTITTGEGGAITTNDEHLYKKLLLLRSHGIARENFKYASAIGPWYYEMQELGFNYRLTDIQAALGISQMKKLDAFKKRRREIVHTYNTLLAGIDWICLPYEAPGVDSCFHLYVIQIDFEKLGMRREEVMNALKAQGIGTQVHYIPVHLHPFYREHFGYGPGDFPISEKFYEKALSIPLYPAMTDADIEYVCSQILSLQKRKV